VLASLLYVGADLWGGYVRPDYRHASQGVSELMSPGVPSRPLVLSLMTARSVLLLAFAWAVWRSASGSIALRFTAIFLIADAVTGQITASFFPAPQRGSAASAAMHFIGTAAESLFIILTMACAAVALGKGFRLYSNATILALLVFGGLAGSQMALIEQNLPTPWLGIAERVNIYAYLLWQAVLAVALLRAGPARPHDRK
jgi:hypothetical protein